MLYIPSTSLETFNVMTSPAPVVPCRSIVKPFAVIVLLLLFSKAPFNITSLSLAVTIDNPSPPVTSVILLSISSKPNLVNGLLPFTWLDVIVNELSAPLDAELMKNLPCFSSKLALSPASLKLLT